MTAGCSDATSYQRCYVYTLYSLVGANDIGYPQAVVSANDTVTADTFEPYLASWSPNLTINRIAGNVETFAVFTPSVAAVPEPATWAMMLLGFGGIGFAVRRERKPARLSQIA